MQKDFNVLILNRRKNLDIKITDGMVFARILTPSLLPPKANTINLIVLYDLKWKNVPDIVKYSLVPYMPTNGRIIEYDILQGCWC